MSDFVVHRAKPALPVATLRSTEASVRATRLVYIMTFLVLAVLLVICAVGPHIPAGE